MPIRVLIVDDHYIVRSGMRDIFEENFGCMVEEAESKEQLLQILQDKNVFDVVLLDINLPDSKNLSLIARIKSYLPEIKICVFTMLSERVYAAKILKLGAAGFIHKSENEDTIRQKLKEMILTNKVELKPLDRYQELKNAQNPFLLLSEKEFEIALLILEGMGNKEISAETNLKQSTVSSYKDRIFTKLDISNNVELFDMALRYEII